MAILVVRRRGYNRRGYYRQSGVYTHPAQVPGVLVRIKDRGRPGKGPKLITGLRKGAMTKVAIAHGYIKPKQTISDIPNSKMTNFARALVKTVGPKRAMKMVQAQITFRKHQSNGFKSKMIRVKNAIRKEKHKLIKIRRRSMLQ